MYNIKINKMKQAGYYVDYDKMVRELIRKLHIREEDVIGEAIVNLHKLCFDLEHKQGGAE